MDEFLREQESTFGLSFGITLATFFIVETFFTNFNCFTCNRLYNYRNAFG